MKCAIAISVALMFSTCVYATPDEIVVHEMARQTHLSEKEIRKNYDACDSGIIYAQKICGSYRWMVQDIRLNAIYKQAMEKARDQGIMQSLVLAQRAWLTYRDAACAYEGQSDAGGGSEEGLYVLSCKEQLTRERAGHLTESLVP